MSQRDWVGPPPEMLDPGLRCLARDGNGHQCLLVHGHDTDHFCELGWFDGEDERERREGR